MRMACRNLLPPSLCEFGATILVSILSSHYNYGVSTMIMDTVGKEMGHSFKFEKLSLGWALQRLTTCGQRRGKRARLATRGSCIGISGFRESKAINPDLQSGNQAIQLANANLHRA